MSVEIPIDPGPVFGLSGISWEGNHALDTTKLESLATVQTGELADGMKLAAYWQSVENAYAHKGYIHAHVEPQPQFDNAAATVSYSVAINEGQQYHMGALVITGLSPAAEGALRAAWQLPNGKILDGTYTDSMFAKLDKPTGQVFGPIPVHYTQLGHFLRVDDTSGTVDVLIDFQ